MSEIHYHAVPVHWTREEKLRYLAKTGTLGEVAWTDIAPNKKHQWLTGDLRAEFDSFIPIEGLNGIFRIVSYGVQTNRDDWVCNFNREALETNVQTLIETYNSERERWHSKKRKNEQLDSFVTDDHRKVKWSSRLKECLLRNDVAVWEETRIRECLYRPFTKQHIYFDEIIVHRRSQFPVLFPKPDTKNRILFVPGLGNRMSFGVCMTDAIGLGDLAFEKCQFFPFHTYDGEDGARRENIPLSTLVRFRNHYGDEAITKWDIFHYVYAVLHHPEYRTRYAANLRRELPRLPLVSAASCRDSISARTCPGDSIAPATKPRRRAKELRPQGRAQMESGHEGTEAAPAFHAYAAIGNQLADLHVHYEAAAEYPLQRLEAAGQPLNWRVEKMRLTKDKTALTYNNFLTLAGLPEAAFTYRLGNRSALEWVIDQYQTHTDPRSGITNDPNREDEPDYIVKLIGKVITVSLQTQKLIAALPPLTSAVPTPIQPLL